MDKTKPKYILVEDKIKQAISIIIKNDSIEYAKSAADRLVTEAWDELHETIPDSEAKSRLKEFADYLVERDI